MKRTTTLIIAQFIVIALLLGNDLIQLLPKPQPTQKPRTSIVTTVPTDYSTVDWTLTQDVPTSISQYTRTTSPFHQTMSFDKPYLQQICFDLTWTDDRAFFAGGLDTLTIAVTTGNGEVYTAFGRSARFTRQGEVQLYVTQRSVKPSSYSYPTPSTVQQENDYVSQLKQSGVNGQQYTVIVFVTTYDRCIFKRFQDTGNDFSLKVTTNYYTPQISRSVKEVQV